MGPTDCEYIAGKLQMGKGLAICLDQKRRVLSVVDGILFQKKTHRATDCQWANDCIGSKFE